MKNYTTVVFFLSLLFFVTSCKKIDTPSDESKKIFASWKYIGSSGGMTGSTISDYYPENTVFEFKDKGVFFVYIDGKKFSKNDFRIELINSMYTNLPTPALRSSNNYLYGSYIFKGNDTLLISDEMFDGYRHLFIKK